MMSGSARSELRRLLGLLEDYLRDGFRRQHGEEAALRVPAPQAVTSESLPTEVPGRVQGAAEPSAPPDSTAGPDSLAEIARQVAGCRLCALHRERNRTVPGEGVPRPLVLVVGEGPGADEDRSGRPFVGRAGQYLDRWLAAIGLDRGRNCFIGNVVKCRPPGNRDPLPEETSACLPYLERQIALLAPRAILALGRVATQVLTGRGEGIGAMRGRLHQHGGTPLVATYHPSAVLRDPSLRAPVWEDLKSLRRLLPEAEGAPADG
jgi:uracil-DNA glycosylase family 4